MLKKTTQINYLFDFYQALLTPKQRDYMELYYLEDHSLGEISEAFNVSRQAVYDNIRRTESMLTNYEDKLKLYDKFIQRQRILDQLSEAAHHNEQEKILALVKILKELD
ncbi:putative DNA-binding protein [Amphibacillus sp. Q70]|uniref:putative DNA-binding protein n=1 Tax=Amphibacillus sp. Q70 TaxID=3453416 RepID=UPI003F843D11